MKSRAEIRFDRSWSNFCVLTLSFGLLLSILLIQENARELVHRWGEQFAMTVDLKDDLKMDQVQSLIDETRRMDGVSSVHFLSKEESQKKVQEDIQQLFPELAKDPEITNSFPATLHIEMKSREHLGQYLIDMATQLEKSPLVERASFGSEWVATFEGVSRLFYSVSGLLVIVLIGSLVGLLATSLRESVYKKQFEIEVFELVGASAWQIRWPFLLNILRMVGFAFVCALVLVFGVVMFLESRVSFSIRFFSWPSLVILCATLITLMSCVALLSLRSINSGWAARERLK